MMVFGNKKIDVMKCHSERWSIYETESSLLDIIRKIQYRYEDLFGAYQDGFVTFWADNYYLTTLPIKESIFNNMVNERGLNTCVDFIPLYISGSFKARNGTDFFFIGRDIQTIQHAFSVDTLVLNDNEEGLQVLLEGKKIAVFESSLIQTVKSSFTEATELARRPISQKASDHWDELKQEKQLKAEAAEKEAAQEAEFKAQEGAGFPKIILTTESPSPFPVSDRLGIISAEYAHRCKMLSSAFAEISSIGKDRSAHTQSALKKAKEVVLLELKREAYLLGADAVVAIDLDYSEIGGAGDPLLFLVANGTAIKFKTETN
jgi:uncharacterized protein YbjQ (UPF0145 family)